MNNRGNPGAGKLKFINEKLDKYSDIWWEQLGKMMTGRDKADRRFAMAEYNKLQCKRMPVENEHSGYLIVKWDNGDNNSL